MGIQRKEGAKTSATAPFFEVFEKMPGEAIGNLKPGSSS
jgi:hypothetical protein